MRIVYGWLIVCVRQRSWKMTGARIMETTFWGKKSKVILEEKNLWINRRTGDRRSDVKVRAIGHPDEIELNKLDRKQKGWTWRHSYFDNIDRDEKLKHIRDFKPTKSLLPCGIVGSCWFSHTEELWRILAKLLYRDSTWKKVHRWSQVIDP